MEDWFITKRVLSLNKVFIINIIIIIEMSPNMNGSSEAEQQQSSNNNNNNETTTLAAAAVIENIDSIIHNSTNNSNNTNNNNNNDDNDDYEPSLNASAIKEYTSPNLKQFTNSNFLPGLLVL